MKVIIIRDAKGDYEGNRKFQIQNYLQIIYAHWQN